MNIVFYEHKVGEDYRTEYQREVLRINTEFWYCSKHQIEEFAIRPGECRKPYRITPEAYETITAIRKALSERYNTVIRFSIGA